MIRYKKLGYVALNVTDIEKSIIYYTEVVGLELVERGTDRAFLTCSDDHHNIILHQADRSGVERVGLEMESGQQAQITFEKLQQEGCNPQVLDENTCRDLNIAGAFRIKDPNGLELELYYGILQLTPQRIKQPSKIKILRLGHVVFQVPNFANTLKFYTETLNFKVSDFKCTSAQDINFAFMRTFPNPYHHSFAIAASPSNQLKVAHVAFMVEDIDDIGRGRNKVKKHNIPVARDIGRHEGSGSIFFYFHDPDGIATEYTLGMEEFPETNPRNPRYLDDTPENSDYWKVF